ncbi:hypothetical protein [Tropheryma whipplei]|uniref:hypothetical protein n=1 Tax=Tropheryma whipplei TaxID=2039 RepID=UPI0002D59683|nr:hypothetical protein [Tropheryma whipplei]
MEDLVELHRSFIPGIKQIRVYLVSVDLLSFYLGCDRLERVVGFWSFWCAPRPQSLRLPIYLLTGSFTLVTQLFIVVSPVLVELRNLR